jgi:hypothetical protein
MDELAGQMVGFEEVKAAFCAKIVRIRVSVEETYQPRALSRLFFFISEWPRSGPVTR